MPQKATLAAHTESWPIEGDFRIARGAKRSADVVVATITDGGVTGRGECVPYARYGESIESVLDTIAAYRGPFEPKALIDEMPAGAARNAIDCACWDYAAKKAQTRVWALPAIPTIYRSPQPAATVMTIGLDEPSIMASNAGKNASMPLKLKLGGSAAEDIDRLSAIRQAVPTSSLIVDVNEGWNFATLEEVAPIAAELGIRLIEQPLPAAEDGDLAGYASPVPIGADEPFHTADDLLDIARRYQAINIKLDKTGGLTAAMDILSRARDEGVTVMVGCMVATSLSMAPATMLAAKADFVDLDGPLLLAEDRTPGIQYVDGIIHPPESLLWG